MKTSYANNLEISLLTHSSGPELYSTFGHSAIRVKDLRNDKDLVFDYGVFDFDEPNFLFKFLTGSLKYKLGYRDFDDYLQSYIKEKREVFEEPLNLTARESKAIYDLLRENYRPKNRYYTYDFLFDNCSTRILDAITSLETYAPEIPTGYTPITFRENLLHYLSAAGWKKFGVDLVLGAVADRKMTFEEEMFLPISLSENLNQYQTGEDQKKLILTSNLILPDERKISAPSKFTQPLVVTAILLLLIIFLIQWKPQLSTIVTKVLYILFGLLGLFLLFMWLGTSHAGTKSNWNVLWLNPIYLVAMFNWGAHWENIKHYGLIGINLIVLLAWALIPQAYNIAIIPLLLLMIYLHLKPLIEARNIKA